MKQSFSWAYSGLNVPAVEPPQQNVRLTQGQDSSGATTLVDERILVDNAIFGDDIKIFSRFHYNFDVLQRLAVDQKNAPAFDSLATTRLPGYESAAGIRKMCID
jgi:hypothetical protein